MKPSAKRALLLPAWPERKLYWRVAGFFQPAACNRIRRGLTGGVGPFFWPCAARRLLRWAGIRARAGKGAGGPLGRWRREEPATLRIGDVAPCCGLALVPFELVGGLSLLSPTKNAGRMVGLNPTAGSGSARWAKLG